MAPREALANGELAVPVAFKPAPVSRLPSSIRFPLFAVLSLTLSTGLNTLVGELTNSEAATVSRTPNENLVLLVVAWRLAVLAISWYGGYDPYDIGFLAVLTNYPYHFFRATFYLISPYTTIVSLIADYLSLYLPAALLLPRHAVHNPQAPATALPNKSLIADFPVNFGASLFAASIYALTLFTAYRTFLPGFLVTRFYGLRTLARAYDSQLAIIVVTALPVGYCAADFLLWRFITATTTSADARRSAFNPETATLFETLQHNFWSHNKKTQVLLQRTVVLAALTGITTWVRTWASLEGAEGVGAAGWASIWVVATGIVGASFAWVGADV